MSDTKVRFYNPHRLLSRHYLARTMENLYLSSRKAPRFPRFPPLALWENIIPGLQQVHTLVTARCSGTPVFRS